MRYYSLCALLASIVVGGALGQGFPGLPGFNLGVNTTKLSSEIIRVARPTPAPASISPPPAVAPRATPAFEAARSPPSSAAAAKPTPAQATAPTSFAPTPQSRFEAMQAPSASSSEASSGLSDGSSGSSSSSQSGAALVPMAAPNAEIVVGSNASNTTTSRPWLGKLMPTTVPGSPARPRATVAPPQMKESVPRPAPTTRLTAMQSARQPPAAESARAPAPVPAKAVANDDLEFPWKRLDLALAD
ncbi:hypothetical protein SDRG_12832 [Saprolegnia diclina VS20]|uniref:Uncharacterized protein n=1 Tax=Saprolegnia diclina (strain VS20) TaxID=1156394 RepID=T0RB08_SAPDV|nr:hypothetical protein SDRG_12832 [Saprolegnia diclina VS20]EQC29368.1 hypothetical protein SDRG_12832 [Saprolegnia diclina VS20]|eukprot:XP_008617135.1 hypothetical protein SDRG_12832 [Saprolegnia diclina VS20]